MHYEYVLLLLFSCRCCCCFVHATSVLIIFGCTLDAVFGGRAVGGSALYDALTHFSLSLLCSSSHTTSTLGETGHRHQPLVQRRAAHIFQGKLNVVVSLWRLATRRRGCPLYIHRRRHKLHRYTTTCTLYRRTLNGMNTAYK